VLPKKVVTVFLKLAGLSKDIGRMSLSKSGSLSNRDVTDRLDPMDQKGTGIKKSWSEYQDQKMGAIGLEPQAGSSRHLSGCGARILAIPRTSLLLTSCPSQS